SLRECNLISLSSEMLVMGIFNTPLRRRGFHVGVECRVTKTTARRVREGADSGEESCRSFEVGTLNRSLLHACFNKIRTPWKLFCLIVVLRPPLSREYSGENAVTH